MSTDPQATPRPLPERPDLRHLKDQAKDLVKAGTAKSITDAQFKIARRYGFPSWPKLKAHVESLEEVGQLKQAIDRNDIERVKTMMTRNPTLHRAPLGYGKDGPLTWVAEWPGAAGVTESDEAGHGEVDDRKRLGRPSGRGRAVDESGARRPCPDDGASRILRRDVNAEWHGDFPIIFAPCESVDPIALKWLLDHGADPNCSNPRRKYRGTALDYVIGTYERAPERLGACIDVLLHAGGTTKYNVPGVLEVLRSQLDRLAEQLDADSKLVHRRFPELDCGSTGARRLLLEGSTLLHVAAEFGIVEAARLLLDRAADVNARATVDDAGVGGQTAIFHAVTRFGDRGLSMAQLLVERGADLTVRARLPGHYERPDEVVECTPLGYALRFQNESQSEGRTIAFLRERGGIE